MAGRCSRRFVDPPKAAWTTIALCTEAWVSTSRGAEVKLVEAQDGPRGSPRRVEPDGLAGWSERRVRQGKSKRLGDNLRGCGGAQKLAAAARGGAGAAAHLGGVFQSDLFLREARADGLHLACVFAVFG